MEWPQELLDIFETEDFIGVHPRVNPTVQDRQRDGFLQVTEWVKAHNGREPQKDASQEERRMAIILERCREDENVREALLKYDEKNLLL